MFLCDGSRCYTLVIPILTSTAVEADNYDASSFVLFEILSSFSTGLKSWCEQAGRQE